MGQEFKGKNVAEIAGDLLMERKKLVGDAAAERKGHPTGAEELARKEEQEAFWKSFTTPEDDARMWAAGKAEGKDDATIKQEISSKKYQRRWELWSKQPDLPSKLKWAKEMQKLGPPQGMAAPAVAEPPAPGPTVFAAPEGIAGAPMLLSGGSDIAALGATGSPVAAPPGMAPPGMAPPGMAPLMPPLMPPSGLAAPTLAELLGETSPPPLGVMTPPRY